MNLAAEESQERVGQYWHIFPMQVQAKRAIWRGIDSNTGVRFIDQAFPEEIRDRVDNQDMSIEFNNGSQWSLCGSNNYDRLVGANPVGLVFSEWALCDPHAWNYLRPILRENDGWVLFITTYRGRNHAYQMVQKLKDNPDWYVDVRDITQTTRNDGTPVLTEADIEAEREDGMPESLIQQEYYCSPIAANEGAYYGRQLYSLLESQRCRLN